MSINNKKIITAVGLGFVCLASLAGFSIALAVDPPATDFMQLKYPDWFDLNKVLQSENKLTDLVIVIFRAFLVVGGIAAFVIIVVGGFRYLTSIGNPSIMSDARSQIFSALLGLTLLLGTYLILNTINPELVALKEPELAGMIGPPPSAEPGQIVIKVTEPTGVADITLAANASSDTALGSSGLTLKADGQTKKITITGGTTDWTTPIQDGSVTAVIAKADGSTVTVKLNIGVGTSGEAAAGIAAVGTASMGGFTTDPKVFFERQITTDYTYDVKVRTVKIGEIKIFPKTNEAAVFLLEQEMERKKLEGGRVVFDVTKTTPQVNITYGLSVTLYIGNTGICLIEPVNENDVVLRGNENRCFNFNDETNKGDEKAWKVMPSNIETAYLNRPQKAAVMFYEKPDFQGRKICLINNTNNISKCVLHDVGGGGDVQWKDNINSLKVIPVADCVTPGQTFEADGVTKVERNSTCR